MAFITVTKTTSGDVLVDDYQSYDIQVEVTANQGVDDSIFVFERKTIDGESVDKFIRVAYIPDLELPIGTPLDNNPPCLYRTNLVHLRVTNREELDEIWTYIQEDVNNLVIGINAGLNPPQTVDVSFGV